MLSKFFLILISVFIFFFSAPFFQRNAMAQQFKCNFDTKPPPPLVAGLQSISLTITSTDTNGKNNFPSNYNADVVFRGDAACKHEYRGAACPDKISKVADANGILSLENASLIANEAGLDAGNLTISVYPAGNNSETDPTAAFCSTTVSVSDQNPGQQCELSVTADASGYTYLHAANVKTPIDSYNIEVRPVIDGKLGDVVKLQNQDKLPPGHHPFCALNSELIGNGYPIGPLPTGDYYFEVKTGCDSWNNGTKCTLNSISCTAGKGCNGGGGSTCAFCSPGSIWDDDKANTNGGKCIDAITHQSTDYDPKSPGNCSNEQTCNHITGCINKKDAIDANVSDVDITGVPCAAGQSGGGTCKKFDSGLGFALPTDIGGFVNALLGVVLSLVGGIAIILIIISGYRLMTSAGNPEKIQGAREELTAAIVGLLFTIFSLVILQVIGVDILHIFGI